MTNEQRAILAAWDKAVAMHRLNQVNAIYAKQYDEAASEWLRLAIPAFFSGRNLYSPALTAYGE